jgi:hypothetical protein
MMKEANAQDAKTNAYEVKVSFNWEGMCGLYSALPKRF